MARKAHAHKDPVEELFEEALKPAVADIVAEMKQPNNPLQNTKKLEQEVMDALMGRHLDKYLEGGFKAIGHEMPKICTPQEQEQVAKEWGSAFDHFYKITESLGAPSSGESKTYDTFKQLLGISDATVSIFYKCGCHLFEQHHFQDAYNVFFVVVYLDHTLSNAWVALGLAAKRNGDIEAALKAFAQATLADARFALPQVYSAECYAETNDFSNAIASLELAQEIADKHPSENPQSVVQTIRNLNMKYQGAKSK